MEAWRGELRMGKLMTKNNSATLRVEQDQLVLEAPMGYRYVLPKDQIAEVRSARAKFWKWSWILKRSIVLMHFAPEVPDTLVFHAKSIGTDQMLDRLQEFGYGIRREV